MADGVSRTLETLSARQLRPTVQPRQATPPSSKPKETSIPPEPADRLEISPNGQFLAGKSREKNQAKPGTNEKLSVPGRFDDSKEALPFGPDAESNVLTRRYDLQGRPVQEEPRAVDLFKQPSRGLNILE